MRRKMQGVTLMELMIVVVIVGILAAIGYPNYQEFSARAKRNEAKAALLQAATNQEKFYLQNQTFTDKLSDLGFPSDTYTTDTGSYDITLTSTDLNANFTVTATYKLGGNEDSKCKTFTIDGAFNKTSLPKTDCWSRAR